MKLSLERVIGCSNHKSNVQGTSSYLQPPKPAPDTASCEDKAPHIIIRVIFLNLAVKIKKKILFQKRGQRSLLSQFQLCHIIIFEGGHLKNPLLPSAETKRKILCCYLQKQRKKSFVAICRNNEKSFVAICRNNEKTFVAICRNNRQNLPVSLSQSLHPRRHALLHRGTPSSCNRMHSTEFALSCLFVAIWCSLEHRAQVMLAIEECHGLLYAVYASSVKGVPSM